MRIIDRKWIDLSLGYQAVGSLQARLESEFGRAVTVGHRVKYRRELTGWQKKRRVFFALVVLAPLSLIALCVAAYYFREVACVLAWWLVTAALVLATLAVAGWSYIREMIAGRPVPKRARVAASLSERWWDSLAPTTLAIHTRGERGEVDFLTLLARSLPDDWLAVRDLFTTRSGAADTDVLLAGPGGVWIFEVVHVKGALSRQAGAWKASEGRKHEIMLEHAPDEQWNQQRTEILALLQARLPHLDWLAGVLQGGVVFSHPKVVLDKNRIEGNTAPYGLASAWLERIHQAPVDERLTVEVCLEVLDALIPASARQGEAAASYASSRQEAERIHAEIADQLRAYVAKMVK
jgi:hypothetical protein